MLKNIFLELVGNCSGIDFWLEGISEVFCRVLGGLVLIIEFRVQGPYHPALRAGLQFVVRGQVSLSSCVSRSAVCVLSISSGSRPAVWDEYICMSRMLVPEETAARG